jgi:DNA-binding NtrC family response regulator
MESRRILVVDDDTDVGEVIAEMLESAGFHVTRAQDGLSTRAILAKDKSIQLVILDSLLQGEDGQSLALYAKGLSLPVVMISGSPAAMEFAEKNHLQLLLKPFTSGQLIDAVEHAFRSGFFGQRDE